MTKINAVGDKCPIPIVKTRNALREMDWNGTVEITVDNLTSSQNLEKFAAQNKCGYSCTENGGLYIVTVTAGAGTGSGATEHFADCTDCGRIMPGTVVAISSKEMGNGDPRLGNALMRSFIFALANAEKLPETVLFYNGGAFLSAEGSESIGDIKAMEAEGTEILTCGTCIDFYGLDKEPPVGSVTNMYTIAEKMTSALRLVKP